MLWTIFVLDAEKPSWIPVCLHVGVDDSAPRAQDISFWMSQFDDFPSFTDTRWTWYVNLHCSACRLGMQVPLPHFFFASQISIIVPNTRQTMFLSHGDLWKYSFARSFQWWRISCRGNVQSTSPNGPTMECNNRPSTISILHKSCLYS